MTAHEDTGADRDRALAEVVALLAESEIDTTGQWRLTQLAGGWSRHTYLLVETESDRSYIVRVKPPAALLDTDLEREYRIYAAAGRAGVPVPAVHALCSNGDNAFGGPYFVMDRSPGRSPMVWRSRERAELEENWRTSQSVATDVVAALAAIHDLPVSELDFLGRPLSFTEAVNQWRATYEKNAEVDDPIVDEAYEWVLSRDPGPCEPSLVHADFRIGNILLADERVSAVIDWELAYLGDPLFDLGYAAMPYYGGKFVRPGSKLIGAFADPDWFVRTYAQRRGMDIDPETIRTYTVQGTLQLIAIIGIGLRQFSEGENTDPRMAWNRFVVPDLRQDVVRLMGW